MSRLFEVTITVEVADDLPAIGSDGHRVSIPATDDELAASFRSWAFDAYHWCGIRTLKVRAERA